jgi:hypothetical protein
VAWPDESRRPHLHAVSASSAHCIGPQSAALAAAAADGSGQLIIDFRKNGGGDSSQGDVARRDAALDYTLLLIGEEGIAYRRIGTPALPAAFFFHELDADFWAESAQARR